MADTITPEHVEKTVGDAIASLGPDRTAVTRDATFEQLDVDSLDLAELSQIISDDFGVELTAADVKKITNVGDLVDLIVSRA